MTTTYGAAERIATLFARPEPAHPMNRELQAILHRQKRALEVAQVGMEARWYVRGGMDPAYASEAARDAQVMELLANQAAYHRHDLAAAFLRGWAEHRPETPQEASRRRVSEAFLRVTARTGQFTNNLAKAQAAMDDFQRGLGRLGDALAHLGATS